MLSEEEFNHGSMLDSDTNNVLDNGGVTLSDEEFHHGSILDPTQEELSDIVTLLRILGMHHGVMPHGLSSSIAENTWDASWSDASWTQFLHLVRLDSVLDSYQYNVTTQTMQQTMEV